MGKKGGNPNWVKGVSGNPEGRKPSHFGKYLRGHPDVPLVLEKILGAALDDKDPRQKDAWKIVANKVAPDLKAQEIKTDVQNHIGVIMMPNKVPIDLINNEADPPPLPLSKSPPVRDKPEKSVNPQEIPQKKGHSE